MKPRARNIRGIWYLTFEPLPAGTNKYLRATIHQALNNKMVVHKSLCEGWKVLMETNGLYMSPY